MGKYYFIQIGEKVKWDMLNDGNCKTMQICTSVHAPIKNNTIINLIPVNDESDDIEEGSCVNSYTAMAEELLPILKDFDKGYWCALQDAASNGVADTIIKEMLRGAGFTFWEAYWHMKQSDFQSDKLKSLIQELFCQHPQYIEWQGVEYPTKSIVIFEGTPDEEAVVVSVERLGNQLLDDMGNWSTREAQEIDEQIYYYLNEDVFNLPDEDIAEFLESET